MKTNDNQSKRIYDKTTKQWYEIPENQYREHDCLRTALKKRMQYRGGCFCPRSKWWLCDGNCIDCEFRNIAAVSLDDPLPDGKGTLADYVPDGAPLIEEVLSEKSEPDQLFERLQDLMPEAKRIGALQDFIGSQQPEITEFDKSLVRKLIQQITVYDDHLAVRSKSGIEIDINE